MKNEIIQGDCLSVLKTIPAESVDCCITSPPYWGLRDYGVDGQLGLESTPEEYTAKLTALFGEVKRVLKKEGTLWLNLGDSYNTNGFSGGGYSDKSTLAGFTNPNTKGRQMQVNRAKDRKTDRWGGGQNKAPGLKPKDLVGIPWMAAFALRADGWYLRQDIIWAKPNPMPESVTDRCTKSHEYIFLLSKSQKYFFDNEAIKEQSVGYDPRMIDGFVPKSINGKHKEDPQNTTNRKKYTPDQAGGGTSMKNHNGYFKENGEPIGFPGTRNKRDVWSVTTSPFPEAHFATFPEELIAPMVKAGCPKGGLILDPFMGAGTTAVVAKKLGRDYVGIELNPAYIEIANTRLGRIPIPIL